MIDLSHERAAQIILKALRARLELEKCRGAVQEIASQKLTTEMDPDTREHADYETGYNECVKVARAALPPSSPTAEG